MNFNDIYSEIVQNKQNHDNGYYNCIPFIGLNRLEKYLPGIEQGTYYLITASTGVKSKINLHIESKTHPAPYNSFKIGKPRSR